MASMIRVVTRDQSLEEARRAVTVAWEPLNPPSPYAPGIRSAPPDPSATLANLQMASQQRLPSGRVCSAAARIAATEHYSMPEQSSPQSGLHILAAEESVLRDEIVLEYMRASLRLLLLYCESMATLESNFSPSERFDVKESWDRDVIRRAEARERLCYETELAVVLELEAKRESAILQAKIAGLLPDFYVGRRALQMEEHNGIEEVLQWHKDNRPFGAGGFGAWMGGGAQSTSRATSASMKSIENGRPPKHTDQQVVNTVPKSEVYRQQILASRSTIAQQERYLSNLGVLHTQNRLSTSLPYAATVPSTPLSHALDVVGTVRAGSSSSATPRTFKMLSAPPGRHASPPPPPPPPATEPQPLLLESADAVTNTVRADGTVNGPHMENLIAATVSAEWVDGWGQYGNDTSLIQMGRDAWMKTKEERYDMFKRRGVFSDLVELEASARRELKSEEITAWLKVITLFGEEIEVAEQRTAESRRYKLLAAADNAENAAILAKHA